MSFGIRLRGGRGLPDPLFAFVRIGDGPRSPCAAPVGPHPSRPIGPRRAPATPPSAGSCRPPPVIARAPRARLPRRRITATSGTRSAVSGHQQLRGPAAPDPRGLGGGTDHKSGSPPARSPAGRTRRTKQESGCPSAGRGRGDGPTSSCCWRSPRTAGLPMWASAVTISGAPNCSAGTSLIPCRQGLDHRPDWVGCCARLGIIIVRKQVWSGIAVGGYRPGSKLPEFLRHGDSVRPAMTTTSTTRHRWVLASRCSRRRRRHCQPSPPPAITARAAHPDRRVGRGDDQVRAPAMTALRKQALTIGDPRGPRLSLGPQRERADTSRRTPSDSRCRWPAAAPRRRSSSAGASARSFWNNRSFFR